ncbi:39S ribosomal protein L46, mitochondrial [Macrosteles quadrilineatus]|uniref:39S ribosomal protein L46, mitochondrial n=1 Tax=Macrosteles quadrilineatus TaxID=74068 RepID=UPI0023E17B10|nr:39S ribosomal protein L46, mitochondrial [Macrosteles quadrilineatus]
MLPTFLKSSFGLLPKPHLKLTFSTATVGVKEKWDLVSSICLERKPKLTKDLTEMELKYAETLRKVEYESSFRSDHEIRKITDKMYAEELKKKDSFVEEAPMQTAQEFEDACKIELDQFKLAERTTPADSRNDTTSTERQLINSLLLVTKQKLGNNSYWLLPQGVRQEGETMRQAAERVLKENCGPNLQTRFMGNAPCGYYKYRYPKGAKVKEAVGAKIFFFKAQLIKGNVSKDVCQEYQWLSQKELNILQEDYLKSVKMFLIDDDVELK